MALGIRFVFVFRVRADEVGEGGTLFLEFGGHDFCGGALAVLFAAVGDDGQVEEVADAGGDIVLGPQGDFPWGELADIFVREVAVAADIDESGTGVDDCPAVGVVCTDHPCAGPAHGESGEG